MRKKIYIIFIILSLGLHAVAQDPVFSQFYAANTFLNPAMTADGQGINGTVNSRFYTNPQIAGYSLNMASVTIPFQLSNFIYGPETRIDHRSGVAVSGYREATGSHGELNTTGLIVTLAHCIQLQREHYLSLGMQGGFVYRNLGGDFEWGSQYLEEYGYDESVIPSLGEIDNLSKGFPTINAGIVYFYNSSAMQDYFKKFNFDAFIGFSAYNINTPNQSFFDSQDVELPLQFKLHGGLKYLTNKFFYLFPNVMWVRQNGDNQINVGMYSSIKTVKSRKDDSDAFNTIIGVWYRVGDSFITSFGVQIQQLKFAVSYDFNASSFTYNNRGKGAVEISVKYSIKNTGNVNMQRGLYYPSF